MGRNIKIPAISFQSLLITIVTMLEDEELTIFKVRKKKEGFHGSYVHE